MRRALNARYDAYVAAHGPVNRFSWRRTGRTDPETGAEALARIRPPQGGFRSDPYAPLVQALEDFDPATQTAAKAAIFSARVVAPRNPRLGADTPADALAICLDVTGKADLRAIARLLGTSEEQAREDLATLVFDDPETGQLVPAAEYLSGPVRAKLEAAELAADGDPRYAVNAEELRKIIPEDLLPSEIEARLGAAWIGESHVRDFLREILEDPSLLVEHPGGQVWTVRGNRHTVLATSTWGTARYPAPALAQAVLEQRRIEVRDETADKTWVLNMEDTIAAQEQAAKMAERFGEWAWEDPARATELAAAYNRAFNDIRLRSYDDAQLSLPGLAMSFEPRPHQVAAVARIIAEPAVLLAHEVGAGKTAEMVMGAMELRRLSLARKPAIVVPNHMVEQFGREALQLYPQARILVTQREDFQAGLRHQFVARCATGDWDIILMSRSAFERIPMDATFQAEYMKTELDRMREFITASKEGDGLTVKRLEGALLRAEERLKKKLDSARDPGITFQATGIDYLLVDEAHAYKNLRTPSNIPDAAIDGSGRASDLDMKISYLRSRNGARVVTFATATPIANSITEAHVMQRYLRPDLLKSAGVLDFDSWAATFGETVTQIEMAPEGGDSFRQSTRFARFTNVPEMLRRWHLSADIKTAEDLKLPVPALVAPVRRRAACPRDRRRHAVRRAGRHDEHAGQQSRRHPQQEGASRRRQHAQGVQRRPQGRPRPAAARPAHGRTRQDRRRSRPDRGVVASASRRCLPRPRRTTSRPSAAAFSWSSATSARPARTGTSTRPSATSSPRAACHGRRSGSSTTRNPTGTRANCSPPAEPEASRSSSGPRKRWESAPTSSSEPSRCITWTAPGGQPTWRSGKAASCARATPTPRFRSSGT